MRMSMSVIMLVSMAMTVSMRASMVSSMRIIVQDLHDDKIADETKDTCYQHIQRFIDYFFVNHALCGFNEQLGSYDIDDSHVDECSQRLCFFPAKGELFGRSRVCAQPDSSQRNEISEDI